MSALPALSGVLTAELRAACGPEAALLGAWVAGEVVPALPSGMVAVRGVYAFPAERVAGLRAWRDTVEFAADVDGVAHHVVLHEASKWARLVLKQHPGPPLWTRGVCLAADGQRALLEQLVRLTGDIDAAAQATWLAAAGLDGAGATASHPAVGPAQRFEQLEAWLLAARRAASRP